ncbi:MAG TPA: hypothetical protein VMU45_01430 [Candidatus Eisenbacteria bacterium]|nr:hypothetical protein [Candidatus Eisenbacteria bacterium]
MKPNALILALLALFMGASATAQDKDGASGLPNETGTIAAAETKQEEKPTPGAHEIMRRAVAKDIINWQAAKDYTFLQRTQEDNLDGNGGVKSSKSETHEILVLYGEPFERLVAKNDVPLPEKEQKKQDEEFDKETRKRENESPEERQKRLQKYEKEREDERAFVREILDAYNFSLVGTETLNGRETWVIDGTPRPGFEGKRRESRLLPKIKPRFWIDQQDYSWAKLRAEFIDTVSFGWVVARLHKGSQFEMQQVRVNDEVWLPQWFDVKLDARVALLKGVRENVHVTYKDYRKFRAETKISVAASEAPQ